MKTERIRFKKLEPLLGEDVQWDYDDNGYILIIEDGAYSTHGGYHDGIELLSDRDICSRLCEKLELTTAYCVNMWMVYKTMNKMRICDNIDMLTAQKQALEKLNI